MKILSLGLDNSILEKNSRLSERARDYGDLVEKYIVIVPGEKDEEAILSPKVKVYGRGGCNKMIKFWGVFTLAKKLLREEKYNLITVQDQYYLGWLAWKLARRFKIGLEIQVHGFEKFSGLRKIIAKFVIPRANAVRVVSERLKKKLVDDFGVKEERITVVPIYTEVKSQKSKVKSSDDKFVFLTVGRLVPVKNISLQIEAFKNLELRFKNIELWIVGDGEESQKLKVESQKLKVEDKVKFLGSGYRLDLENTYAQADAFLLTSNYEGWGLVVIEAAYFGLPIIMTDVGCAGEVIKDGESGIVIPVGGQKELEAAMRKIIEDEDLRQKLGEGAKEAVEKLPSKEETLRLYLESWEKAVSINN
ncbi:MAG: glycosyltransferase family 4 protein [Patescibacteria group bacterium]|nr:glycosyltransferase family 4 protein [Patescibacteria group bacterium]